MNGLPAYDHRYIKTKIKKHVDKIYTNFRGLGVVEGGPECKYFTIISIDFLLAYEKKILSTSILRQLFL